MSAWQRLERELAAWADQGRPATLWWRDDDAVSATPALRRLLSLSGDHGVPVSLALIPRDADASLADALAGHPTAAALQHGWAHANHAPPTRRKAEFGPHRPLAEMLADAQQGWQAMTAFAGRLPVLVAPWNRLDAALIPRLPEAGLRGVSTLGPRPAAEPSAGVRQVNVHVDLIDWADGRRFVGEDRVLDGLARHLGQRRAGAVDADEPTGLMTHHLVHTADGWRFLDRLFAWTGARDCVRWLAGEAVFSA